MRRLAAILALMPTLAAAGPYDGTYKQVANADCANVGVDGGALKIEDGIFFGVDVQCRMTRPVDVLQMDATLYTMQCSNDDEVWTERAMLMDAADDDGIIMIWNGYAFAYSACEPE
ncbi:MAG: hypothetical protein ABJO29_02440 [Yoonia sp.]|uniref:hypothetical protein n=1 Tax=Rhodobacterales TaxID=204455 RepID=UPI001FF438BE|nr:hypothetical protein [Loktanella sp. F6476L]MCK0121302.1 hypothetical protein [Loktanella sp. F6476L]